MDWLLHLLTCTSRPSECESSPRSAPRFRSSLLALAQRMLLALRMLGCTAEEIAEVASLVNGPTTPRARHEKPSPTPPHKPHPQPHPPQPTPPNPQPQPLEPQPNSTLQLLHIV